MIKRLLCVIAALLLERTSFEPSGILCFLSGATSPLLSAMVQAAGPSSGAVDAAALSLKPF